ncbi:MAG: TatD family hydrolase [Proteobacteria bacterium]|nr:TatD family hydrolase [Pseudomonadota bacterium]HQR04727.1 TatD family hydrolase [Rhodocyclaceae bacterium]
MLIDTHCHLDAAEFDPDRESVWLRAFDGGVERILIPAVERANFSAVASLCRHDPAYRGAYGIHPMYVGHACEDDLDALRDVLIREPTVAVGEIGLDHFVEERDDRLQEFYFTEQLRIARALSLPVVLHVRRAIDPVLKALRRIPVPGGIAHAFNGSRQQADEFIRLGFKLGFGGAMTYPRALRIRALAVSLPLESIVLETDAPDIPPEWCAGRRNEPGDLPRIARILADMRGISEEALIAATGCNAQQAIPGLV